jgi:ferrous iron transport protein B
MRQKVANFPSVTVELKSGKFDKYQLIDFSDTYSSKSLSKDQEMAIKKLHEVTQKILCQ